MFNAIIGQSPNQYYDASGKLIVDSNPAVKTAWDESMKVASGGLSAKLSQFSTAWNVAFTTGSFATIACPSWMVGYIKSEAGAMTRPVEHRQHPRQRRRLGWLVPLHPEGQQAPEGGVRPDLLADRGGRSRRRVFKAVGNFPSNIKAAADPTVAAATDTYFSGGTDPDNPVGAPIGKIFGDSAAKLQPAILGPHDGDVKNAISTAITRVETGAQTPGRGLEPALTKDIPAAVGS